MTRLLIVQNQNGDLFRGGLGGGVGAAVLGASFLPGTVVSSGDATSIRVVALVSQSAILIVAMIIIGIVLVVDLRGGGSGATPPRPNSESRP